MTSDLHEQRLRRPTAASLVLYPSQQRAARADTQRLDNVILNSLQRLFSWDGVGMSSDLRSS